MDMPWLSQNVLLDIIYFCDVSTLKQLRLTHRSIHDLINAYQVSIYTDTSNRLFSRDKIDAFQPLNDNVPAILRLFELDYRLRTTQWLTDVALENLQEDLNSRAFGNIGANETEGDPIREYVNAGWSIFWHLSDLAMNVVCEMTKKSAMSTKGHVSSWTRGYLHVLELEAAVEKKQVEYVNHLTFEKAYGYSMMHAYLGAVFRDRVFDDPRDKSSDWRTGNEFGIYNSWLNWLALREGPRFFARAWATKEGNLQCEKLITTEWSKRSKEQVRIEQATAKEVEESLLHVGKVRDNALLYIGLMGWALHDREIERVHRDISYHLGRRLPHDVILSIERDYSDYSS